MPYTPGQYLPASFFKPKSLIIKHRNTKPSNDLTNAIISFLRLQGAVVWRNNNMGVFDRTRGIYRPAPTRGISDILGCFKGLFLAVEVKTGHDKLSPFQESFLNDIKESGGLTFVARDIDTFIQEWNSSLKSRII